MTSSKPGANEWWPHLSIESKHAILEDPSAPLPETVRAEMGELTGEPVPEGACLDEEERRFIATQTEPVD